MKNQFAIFFFATVIALSSCKKLDISRINKITTDNIEITDSIITATGTIVDISKTGISEYGHCWSTEQEPTVSNFKTTLGASPEKGQFSSILTDLKTNTLYYIRAYLSDGNEVKYGNEINFSASIVNINITTDGFQIQTISSVNTFGSISGIESVNVLDYGHCWSLSNTPSITDNITSYGVLSDSRTFNSSITGLNLMTSYFVRSYAKMDESVFVYGNTIEILIPDLIVKTDSFTLQGNTEALLEGEIMSIGIFPVTDHGHCWATTTSAPSYNNNKLLLGATAQTGIFNTTLPNLQTGVTYYFRAFAIFGNTVRYGTVKKIQN